MSFFNKVGKNLGKTAKSVTKKSEEMIEITKLNLAVGNEEDKIKKLLLEIGNEAYGLYSQGESIIEAIDQKCAQVKELEANIASLKEKIKSIKEPKTAETCSCEHCEHCEHTEENT